MKNWNNAVNDLTIGPGSNNDAVKILKNIGNEIERTPINVVKEVKKILPRITL
ncbi:hypothetical protein [Flavivirga sp. 57AJ16]|uniref:hypothetical protein n=1 Tax=Flavivirga sp. 57AJ16 TaxID=3025307 RepID=UPI00236557FE|nr:hypothetical protein [Flavivirga sp. 57AJ16]MDD7885061.1 hypothetical protein [Flavivirga sp. 57AJ16]